VTQLAARRPNRLLRPRTVVEADAIADALHEILGSWVCASPYAGRDLLTTLDQLAREYDDLDRLTRALDEVAAYAAQHDRAEAAGLLLDASDSIRRAADRIDAATTTTKD
jgi:hypothetical protein